MHVNYDTICVTYCCVKASSKFAASPIMHFVLLFSTPVTMYRVDYDFQTGLRCIRACYNIGIEKGQLVSCECVVCVCVPVFDSQLNLCIYFYYVLCSRPCIY